MKKEEFIEKYGQEAYEKRKHQSLKWYEENPEAIKTLEREKSRKGGKRYIKKITYNRTGLQGKKGIIRGKHGNLYRSYKNIIDPEGQTQIHHEWIPGTADFRGVALVEAVQHQYGFIDVIQILEGEITLFSEAGISGGLA